LITSSTQLLVVLGSSAAGANVSVTVVFNAGGEGASASRYGLIVLGSPALESAAPAAVYISSTFTVIGQNFIHPAQDENVHCTSTIGGAEALCALWDATRIKLTLRPGSIYGGTAVSVTFLPSGVNVTSVPDFIMVLGAPTVTSITPTAGYISSSITVTGSNFITTAQDPAATCNITFGGSTANCTLLDSTRLRFTIGSGILFGMSALRITVGSAGAVAPHNQAETASNFIELLDAPSLSAIVPSVIYKTGMLTVFGENFITVSSDESAFCTCTIGGLASTCSLLSSYGVRVTSTSSLSPSSFNVSLTFMTGGAQTPFNFVKSPENFVRILPDPVISSISFAESTFGTYVNSVTVVGSNFITLDEDAAMNCSGSVGLLSALSCSILDSQTAILSIADSDLSSTNSFSLTIQAGGIVFHSSLPVSSFDLFMSMRICLMILGSSFTLCL
jgi:hypothetical protein